ncbi:MAG: ArsR family transcriptional regulator, partial [Myxococcales bacterium]|nr:ArsR family transcriptional regulator [Myxococcales bacterium]
SQPAVSRHLRVLRQSGLVRSRSRAQRRIYTLTPEPLDEITRWLQQHRAYWQERLDDLGTVLAAQSEAKREARR